MAHIKLEAGNSMMQMIVRFHMLEPFVALSKLMTRIGSRCALGKARNLLNEVSVAKAA